jgi:hypothetical protein
VSRRTTLDVEIRRSFSLMCGAQAADPIILTRSEMLIGDEKLRLFYLFYQVEIR